MASYEVRNFGCRTNQAEGAAVERQLRAAGFVPATAPGAADLVVLNTCTVTAHADADARAAIRRLRRENAAVRIVVTGCYAQRAPEELRALPGVDWVVGHEGKDGIAALAAGREAALIPAEALGAAPAAHTEVATACGRTRPNVKVQDGCNNRCAFCVIPSVRGASRSRPLGLVLAEIQRHADEGAAEVVLTGINLGQWGRDLDGKLRFPDLVAAILARTSLRRLRLSSVEPMDWSDDLIALMAAEPRLAPHAHIPLQSGCDAVLRRMHRRYRPWHYAEKARRIRELLPDAAIGADVMAAFPGESEAEFEESRAFIAALPLTYLHVFTYSPRPGTEAARRANEQAWRPVAPEAAARRSRELHALGAAKRAAFAQRFAGGLLEVVTLEPGPDATPALSGNFLQVTLPGSLPGNQTLRVRVTDATRVPLAAVPA